ncbi:AraC family transcriptional regulator [Pseudogemmobacter bohemicus]|uniref:AraC family transcriptional regulator n=1 Tax=Pseudogemmobacter bohemicus TaxID=2250708 RepID=UPI000DD40D04|nr:AraC family transcriptional regulator [Pseudogemmobacter bohemicus]
MSDPLEQVIGLLRPEAVGAKEISAAGSWAVQYVDFGKPAFGAMTQGRCLLQLEGEAPLLLEEGDFLLLPATPTFTFSSLQPAPVQRIDEASSLPRNQVRYGRQDGPPEMRQFGGWFRFGSPDADLLVSLLPRMVLLRGVPRLAQLVRMLGEEAARGDIGRDLILGRLVEILLIEALRAAPSDQTQPGLLQGLADPRIGAALRALHGDIARAWTVPDLAREAGMSRSVFFGRFAALVGSRPMAYLATWRMAVAKDLLRRGGTTLEQVAERVGYGSASTFSTAFSRHMGQPPGRFMKATG